MKRFSLGDRVVVDYPDEQLERDSLARCFNGSTGVVVDVERSRYSPARYRVALDAPVSVPGLAPVEEDLWNASLLAREGGARHRAARRASRGSETIR